MALPKTGSIGQKLDYNGYTYQWIGTGWKNLGVSTLKVGATTLTNTGITAGTTSLTSAGVTAGTTTMTANGLTAGTTTVTSAGLTAGTTTVSSNGVTAGTTTLTSAGITAGNTSITSNGVTAGTTSLTSNGISVGTGCTAISITSAGMVAGTTKVSSFGIQAGTTLLSSAGLTTPALVIGTGAGAATLDANNYSGNANTAFTANNALHLGGRLPQYYLNTIDNFTVDGDFTINGAFTFASDITIANGASQAVLHADDFGAYFTGTAYTAENAFLLNGYAAEDWVLGSSMPDRVGALTSLNSLQLGGVAACNYIQRSGSNILDVSFNSITANGPILAKLSNNPTVPVAAPDGYLLASNGTSNVYWKQLSSLVINTNLEYNWTNNHSFSKTINGTANNALYLGGVSANSFASKVDVSDAVAYTLNQTLVRNATYTGQNIFNPTRDSLGHPSNTVFYGDVVRLNSSEIWANTTPLKFYLTGGLVETAATLDLNQLSFSNNYLFGSSTTLNREGLYISRSFYSMYYTDVATVTIEPRKIYFGNTSTSVNINNGAIELKLNADTTVINTTAIYIGNSTANATVNTTFFTGTANNAVYMAGLSAASYALKSGTTFTGNVNFSANVEISSRVLLNSSAGLQGQVLTSNGTGGNVFWSTIGGEDGIGTVQTVSTGNGLTGGPIVRFGTVAVKANSGITATGDGLFVNTGYIDTFLTPTYAKLNAPTFTGNVYFSNTVTFRDNVVMEANLILTGNTVIIGANNLIVNDAVISLHTLDNLAPWTVNDGKLVGVAYHYYNNGDKQALLALNQTTQELTYWKTSVDAVSGDPSGTDLGTIKADSFKGTNFLADGNGVNAASFSVGSTFVVNSSIVSIPAIPLLANGTYGTSGQVLLSNGSIGAPYWSTVPGMGTVTTVNSGNGLTGGPFSTTGTLSVVAGNGTVVDSNGVRVNANTGIIVNTNGVFVDSTYIGQISSNNSYYLVNVDGNKFVQNTDSRTLSGNLTFSGTITTFSSNVIIGNYISSNAIPSSNDHNLGNTTHVWNKLHVSSSGVYIGNSYLTDDFGGTGFLVVNGFITNTANVSYATIMELHANTLAVNSITTSDALSVNSGGTGINVYSIGDITYANGAFSLNTLSIPSGIGVIANGQILQIIDNVPGWGPIDCGEFEWA